MLRAYEIAITKLDYVYLGNINIQGKSDTLCPECGTVLISRLGYRIDISGLNNRHCANCGKKINILN
jgi:pyruvate formate lyase activating enzyme